MGTRSAIGIKHGDVVKAVYCHWDGYLDHNGAILNKYYINSVKVNMLVSMGDLSSLGASIGEQHSFDETVDRIDDDDIITSVGSQCTFYNRDRGEQDVDFKTFQTEQDYLDNFDMGAEYYYLFKDNQWYVSTGDKFTLLADAFKDKDFA
jgi:hypothetical protein